MLNVIGTGDRTLTGRERSKGVGSPPWDGASNCQTSQLLAASPLFLQASGLAQGTGDASTISMSVTAATHYRAGLYRGNTALMPAATRRLWSSDMVGTAGTHMS